MKTNTSLYKSLAVGVVIGCYQLGAGAQAANPVAPAQVCVTNGEVSKQSDQNFSVESPSSRAVVPSSDDNFGAIEFEYLGPTSKDAPLASGRVVRQLGVKLNARDSCNVIYVMWNIDPDVGIQISTKINPRKSTHAECGVKGYKMVYQSKPGDIPAIRVGEPHRLEAALQERNLTVKIDGKNIWQGDVGADAVNMSGYSGIRTDNVRVRFKWLTVPVARSSANADAPKVSCKPVVARAAAGS
jgi:hypothetical protein